MRLLSSPPRLAALALLTASFASPARAGELRHFEDASLHAVQFVDAQEGWAVGDEGVIWHTIDGGQNWERQPSGVRAALRSLHFLDGFTGWVAGREELPGGGSAGVLLYTRDGGCKWERILLGALPGLNVVRFVDARTGYLAGDGADQYPTGVFHTTDGGRTWQPVPGPRCPSWEAGDFDPSGGALAGAWNRLATVRGGKLHLLKMDTLGGRSLRGLQLRGEGGIAVGQGGLVLLSARGKGSEWDYPDLKIPPEARGSWDFHAVGGAGPHLWAVGRPGSVALHSPDGGRSWEVVRTGQPLPLNGVFFRDERRGWAVGELGTVLATTDGGKTWRAQRRGGQRAAALFLHARPTGVPADTVALLGGHDGYLTAGLRVTGPDPDTARAALCGEGARLAQAFREAGGAGAEMLWQFPVPSHLARAPRSELLKSWDRQHGGSAAESLLRQLVLAMRTWQPAVVLTDPAGSEHGAEALVAEAAREAFRRAADPAAFPEQTKVFGLEAWAPSKLYARCEDRKRGQVTLDLTAVSGPLGSTPQEFASGPASLLAAAPVSLPAERSFRLLAHRLEGAEGHHALMQGIALAPGGLARRAVAGVDEPSAEALKGVRQRAHLRALSETPPSELTSPDRLLAQVGPALEDMPAEQAAPAAFAVARRYAATGQWGMAREVFLLVVDRYPAHPLARDAYTWLLRHNSSSEARRRHELGQFLLVGKLELGVPPHSEKDTLPVPGRGFLPDPPRKPGAKPRAKPPEVPEMRLRMSQEKTFYTDLAQARRWYQSSLDLEPRLAAFGPLFVNDPAVQFCLQSARRNLGDLETPRKWYASFAARQPEGPWRDAALAELWLGKRVGAPPKPALVCRAAGERPYLDGKLDDPCWQGCPAVRLRGAAGDTLAQYPTEVRVAYDEQFLYLGVRCGHPPGQGERPARARTRDASLRGHDRVSLVLDLDRDYSTWFHLQIDARGCVCDDCWGDRTWDPRWFAAVHRADDSWTVEAAIPLVALTGDAVTAGRAWAVNLVRVLPGRGVQAFSLPAEVPEESMRPEGMGLLIFTQDVPRQAAAK